MNVFNRFFGKPAWHRKQNTLSRPGGMSDEAWALALALSRGETISEKPSPFRCSGQNPDVSPPEEPLRGDWQPPPKREK